MRRIVGVALLAALCAAPVAAQEADTALAEAPVRMSNFPYLLATPNDGVFGAFRVIRYRQAPWDARVTNLREHSVDAGYSTRGAWFVRGDYKRLWLDEGWRVRGSITASREARVARSDSVEFVLGVPPNFVERQRQMGWVDVTRRLQGRLQAAVRVSLDRQRLDHRDKGCRIDIHGAQPVAEIIAVSGSGPAYAFYFLEGLEEAARQLGFGHADARKLAYATFAGAIKLAQASDEAPGTLRAQVTSKGGTTERGIGVLDEHAVKATFVAAVKAAAARATELGDALGKDA